MNVYFQYCPFHIFHICRWWICLVWRICSRFLLVNSSGTSDSWTWSTFIYAYFVFFRVNFLSNIVSYEYRYPIINIDCSVDRTILLDDIYSEFFLYSYFFPSSIYSHNLFQIFLVLMQRLTIPSLSIYACDNNNSNEQLI